MFRHHSFVSCLLLLSLTGCDSDDEPEARAGRGSSACREWQGAICDWEAKCKVSAAAVAECRHDAAGISCGSDQRAADCAAQLAQGACVLATLNDCNFSDVADPAPATAACQEYVDAVCSAAERCGESKADCLAQPAVTELCTGVWR